MFSVGDNALFVVGVYCRTFREGGTRWFFLGFLIWGDETDGPAPVLGRFGTFSAKKAQNRPF